MGNKQLFLKELKARYKRLYNAVQPIPYIRDRLYCVDRVFVESGIEYFESSWVLLGSYHRVFYEPNVKSKRRVLTGEPGYGKSTLTLQYAYDWCNGVQGSYLNDVEILVLLRLRQLGGVKSIYKAIKRFILSSRSQLTEQDIESIMNSSTSVLVILDGFDEYPDEDGNPDSDVMKIILSQMFQHFEVLLTTRYSPKQYVPGTKRLRLTGFDDRARDEYIHKAVVGDDNAAANEIKRRLRENPVLGDLCQVPLFFVMFAHMSNENKDFQTFKTVTSFFQYMVKCFHSHMRNKMDSANVQIFHMLEHEEHHIELDRVAFEGLSKENQQIVWKKQELMGRLGKEFYDQYIRVGILVEEDIMGEISGTDSASTDQHEREIRFYHKVFCEWFAAYYLVKYAIALNDSQKLMKVLGSMDPIDVQYCYRFACGLNSNAAGTIIDCVKQREGGDKFAILCLLEQKDRNEDTLNTVKDLCEHKIQFQKSDSTLLQRSTVQLIEIASRHEIPIKYVSLQNCYSTADLSSGNHLQLKSNVCIPVLTTLINLSMEGKHGKIVAKQFTGILQYSSKCLALRELDFSYYLLPRSTQVEAFSVLRSKDVQVLWYPKGLKILNFRYGLCLESGLWKRSGTVMTDEDYEKEVRRLRQWEDRHRQCEDSHRHWEGSHRQCTPS